MAFTGRIDEIWAQYNGQHLTLYRAGDVVPVAVEIPEGASWELHAKTIASWPEAAPWATAVTLMGEFTYGDAAVHAFSDGSREFAIPMGRMPARSVDVGRIKFWRNQAYTNVPPPEGDR